MLSNESLDYLLKRNHPLINSGGFKICVKDGCIETFVKHDDGRIYKLSDVLEYKRQPCEYRSYYETVWVGLFVRRKEIRLMSKSTMYCWSKQKIDPIYKNFVDGIEMEKEGR